MLPRKQKIKAFVKILYNNYFQADLTFLAAKQPPSNSPLQESRSGVTVPSAKPFQETRLPNGIKVFGDATVIEKISSLVNEFPSIWEFSGFVRILPEHWMTVPLRDNWQSRLASIKPKVYSLGKKSNKLVNKIFDELQRQGRLVYTKIHTPFNFSVLVVWKPGADKKKKGQAVIDIRRLNELVVPDAYPLPLQANIIANV